ncbi:MAG: hypothetical protein ICV60_03045 [Pyrinomonadaceae bacterium]|nr:hypothetical protein [Pyrinomonadaceae bacterium]
MRAYRSSRTRPLIALTALVMLVASVGVAQERPATPGPQMAPRQTEGIDLQAEQYRRVSTVTPSVTERINASAANVRNLQNILLRVEGGKYLKEQDAKELETSMNTVAQDLYAAFNDAVQQAEAAAKSEGKSGGTANLLAFERDVEEQLVSIQKVESGLKNIQRQVEIKTYKLEPAFRPDLAPNLNQLELKQFGEFSHYGSYKENSAGSFVKPWCGNPANAAMPKTVAPCVSPCWNKQWGACLTCILSKAPSVVGSYNAFQSCWNNAKAPWKAVKQAGCLSSFVYVLA